MKINFNEYQKIFNKTKNVYLEAKGLDVELKFRKDIFFTMRGAIKYASLFDKKRKYVVFVNINKTKLLSELDETNITAWLAHELTHIIEYEKMSNWNLFVFLINYTFSLNFRFKVEKRVNAYAANNGFANEMFSTWKKFLSLGNVLNSRYKKYVIKNCRPDWDQVKETALKIGINQKEYESFL
jgi:hypothetical protein